VAMIGGMRSEVCRLWVIVLVKARLRWFSNGVC
jgi:hypothetical protein